MIRLIACLLVPLFMCVQRLPAMGDNCIDAIEMEINEFPNYDFNYNGSFLDHTLSLPSNQCSESGSTKNDVWFTFVAVSNDLVFEYQETMLEFYKGSDCSSLEYLKCIDGSCNRMEDLQMNERYYVRAIGWTHWNYQLSLHITPPGPFDTNCETAFPLSLDVRYEHDLVGTDNDPIDGVEDCQYFQACDVWCQFEADTPFYKLIVSNATFVEFVGQIQLFENDCSEENLVYCHDDYAAFKEVGFDYPLTNGSTYYVRISASSSAIWQSTPITITLERTEGRDHDYCHSAEEIKTEVNVPACETHTYYKLSQDFSIPLPPCWSEDEKYDAWFSFQAKNENYIVTNSDEDGNIAVYSGTCENAELLGCGDEIELNDLALDDTYLLRVVGDVNFCISPEIPNDVCQDAVELFPVPSTNEKTYSFTGATLTGSDCASDDTRDIWFKFTATSTRIAARLSVESNASVLIGSGVNMSLYTGSCDALTYITCGDNNFSKRFESLTIGQVYYLRVSTKDVEAIEFKIESIPEHTNYQNALDIESDTCMYFATSNLYNSESLWYIFIPEESTYKIDLSNSRYLGIYKYDVNQIPQLYASYYGDSFDDTLLTQIEFTAGETYYINVNKGICIEPMVPVINDDWKNPELILASPWDACSNHKLDYSDTSGALWEQDNVSCVPDKFSPDAWYYFIAESETVFFNVNSALTKDPGNYQVFELDGLNTSVLPCPFIDESARDRLIKGLKIGKVYLFRFFDGRFSGDNFSFCLKTPPSNINDNFELASNANVNPPYGCQSLDVFFYNTVNTPTESFDFEIVCDTEQMDYQDVWYRFIAPKTEIGIRCGDVASIGRYEVYTLKNNKLHCHQPNQFESFFGQILNKDTIDNLIVGDEYLLRFSYPEYSNSTQITENGFCLYELPSAPINDVFDQAIDLLASDNLMDCYATDTLLINGSTDGNVWFKFTATDERHQYYVYSELAYFEAEVYTEENNVLNLHSEHAFVEDVSNTTNFFTTTQLYTQLYFGDFNITLANINQLEIGKEYYIKMRLGAFWTAIVNDLDQTPVEYVACLKTPPPNPPNNTFETAQYLSVSVDTTSQVVGYATMSVPNYQDYPQSDECLPPDPSDQLYLPEVWYSFDATQEIHTLIIDNQADFANYNAQIVNTIGYAQSKTVNLSIYASLYHQVASGEIVPVECDIKIDRNLSLAGLVPSDRYYIKLYYQCLNYLTELNFGTIVSTLIDEDSDGYFTDSDCNDSDPTINPGQIEITYTGIDEDCDPLTLDDDLDQDGFVLEDDCDDQNAEINPNAVDIPGNLIDEDCDGQDAMVSSVEDKDRQWNVYPNPAQSFIKVSNAHGLKIKLQDITGHQRWIEYENGTINIEHLVAGVYILILEREGVLVGMRRFVKI